MKSKNRHISILDYYERLQIEYLLYELRSKIYPSAEEKARYKKVLEFKREKIDDISGKNSLRSMFEDDITRQTMIERLFGDGNIPEAFNKRDKYFYYFIGSDFSHNGEGCKLLSYDLDKNTGIVEKSGISVDVSLIHIRRIF